MLKKLTLHAPFFAVMVAGVALMIVASPATMSAKTSLVTAGTVRNVCGQPVGVRNDVSKTLDPSKTTFSLGGRIIYFYHDRYDGELEINPATSYEFRVVSRRDGSFEASRGRRVPSCQNNPAKG